MRIRPFSDDTSTSRDTAFARISARVSGTAPAGFDLLELGDGRVFERFSKRLLVDERPIGRVWSFRDITQRRKAQDALRAETRMLELLNRTGTTIAENLDVHVLLQSVSDAATQLSATQVGWIFYRQTDRRETSFRARLSRIPRRRRVLRELG